MDKCIEFFENDAFSSLRKSTAVIGKLVPKRQFDMRLHLHSTMNYTNSC